MRRVWPLLLAAGFALVVTLPLVRTTAAPGPQRGGTLVFALLRPIATLDGHRGIAGSEHVFQWLIYDQLIRFDETGKPIPGLVESWSQPNPTTLILRLRPGVKFHDGSPLNAEAVKFNIERVLDPVTASAARSEMSVIDRVEVVDDLSVQLVLKQPAADLLLQFSDRAGMMLSPAAVRRYGRDIARFGVGAGPFKVAEFVPGDRLVLDRNPDYWEQGRPYLDRIVFKIYTNPDTALLALRAGEVQIVQEVPGKDAGWIRHTQGLVYINWPTERYLQFNMNRTKPPLDNVLVRRALAHAVDRRQIARLVYAGDATPVDGGIFPKGHWAYCPEVRNYPYNPAAARTLLQQAGYGQGLSLEVSVQATFHNTRLFEIAQSMMERSGIKLVPVVSAGPEGFQGFFIEGKYNMRSGQWAGRPDPSATLFINFHSGGSQNAPVPQGGFKDPTLDRLIEQGRGVSDLAARRSIYCEVQKIVTRDVHILALAHETWSTAALAEVGGLKPQLLAKPLLREVWLVK